MSPNVEPRQSTMSLSNGCADVPVNLPGSLSNQRACHEPK